MFQGNEIESSVVVNLYMYMYVGMDSSGSAKLQRAEQQLFAVTPGAFYKHSEHKEKINEEKNVFKTSGDKHSLGEVEFEVEGRINFIFKFVEC